MDEDVAAHLHRYELVKGGMVTELVEDVAKYCPPVPGLQWVLRRLVGGLAGVIERHKLSKDEIEELQLVLGSVLTTIERKGLDIELSGPLRLVSFLSYGLSAAVECEARARGIKVVGAVS